ncbi:hypothetical protein [Nocardia sp. NPDC046763]|uniref:hypothetical protein n=1 Tax=Nocardia sp. NPDC046763 TaxID=3155256 RepID=UPI00340D1098
MSSGNAVFTRIRQSTDHRARLIAHDPKNGHRAVVLGRGPTAAGEKPALTMNLDVPNAHVCSAPWGVLVAGPGDSYAVIPAER